MKGSNCVSILLLILDFFFTLPRYNDSLGPKRQNALLYTLSTVRTGMAKAARDLILRDRLQFDVDTNGDTTLVYGRVDMSAFVNIVKREGFAVKEVRYQLRDPSAVNTGMFNPLLSLAGESFATLKVFATTTAYENAQDVGIASPDVISVFELSTVRDNPGATGENFANNVVSDLLIGVSANDCTVFGGTTLEVDIMIIGEPVKLNEADMTEMLTQGQDL